MGKKGSSAVVSHEELARGFRLCVENAQELLEASGSIHKSHPAKALALAQLGQEELGKSFLLLTAFTLGTKSEDWDHFWRSWRNHDRKAMAAYLYEWLNPFRIEMEAPGGRRLSGLPLFPRISEEKEVGLYVDFDSSRGAFTAPRDRIQGIEAASRLAALMTMLSTSIVIHDVLNTDPEFRFPTFAELPLALATQFIRQEAVPALYHGFAARSAQHTAIIEELKAGFEGQNAHFLALQQRRAAGSTPEDA